MPSKSSLLMLARLVSLLFMLHTALGQQQQQQPELFAPGVISIGAATTYRPAFMPDGHTVYYTMEVGSDYVILISRLKRGRWTQPEIAPFSGRYSDAEPFISPDGSKLVFASKRPIVEGAGPKKDYDLWMVKRERGGSWSAPVRLDESINTDAHELYPALASDGSLYFSRFAPGGIWRASLAGGHYEAPVKLSGPINADRKEAGAYVAPDQRYIIFEAKGADSLGGTDFYISYRQGADEWTAPRNLGAPINSSAEETCAVISPDGRFLFFASNRQLPEAKVSLGQNLKYAEMLSRLNSPGRGRWHIYYISTGGLNLK